MEAISCVRSVVLAANHYQSNPGDVNFVNLQRQLDVLISITNQGCSLKFFNPSELLTTECLTCLVDFLNDPHSKAALIQKSMILLTNLCHSEEVKKSLQLTFDLTSCLANYLRSQPSVVDQNTVLVVKLLHLITYNFKVSSHENYMEDLIRFLVKHIQNKESDLTEPCLGLLANLCRHNFSLQTHIKSLDNIKQLYKKLMNYFSYKNQTIVIYALAIVTSLFLQEPIGEKVFSGENIYQTFHLTFNILVNSKDVMAQRYAVDLFLDFIKHERVQNSLLGYSHLKACLRQVLSLLCTGNTQSVAKILELLLGFCSVKAIRCVLCKTLFAASTSTQPRSTPAFISAVTWAKQSIESHDQVPLLAMEFIREIYEEILDLELTTVVSPDNGAVLSMAMECLLGAAKQTKKDVRKHFIHVVKAIKLLITLCSDEALLMLVAESVTTKTCKQLVEFQLDNSAVGISYKTSNSKQDWSDSGIEVVLNTMQLMLHIRRQVPGMDAEFHKLLQDFRLIPFLAAGLTSDKRDRVQIALKLLTKGATLNDFPTITLGDAISSCNHCHTESKENNINGEDSLPRKRPRETGLGDKENIFISPVMKKERGSQALDDTVQGLIDKMQNGLELKDCKASEIINVYEHRLQSLQTKENHLQDLLEAKAMALAQADRLIAQYRCRRAQSDAEATKLRSMVQDYERRSEEYREQLNEMTVDREKLQAELDQLATENARLECVEIDHQELTQIYTEQTQKLENVQRTLTSLKQEHETVTEMHEMLRRHNENLKQQHDVACGQLAELEEERKNISRQLKEEVAEVQELNRTLHKTEERLKRSEKNLAEMEVAIDKLRNDLSKTEDSKKTLQHQVSTLELVCQQHETALKEAEEVMRHQKVEIDKHNQIAALIHNLSSGQTPATTAH